MRCRSCQRENRDGARFCRGCGAALPISCPRCGAPAEPDSDFCDRCGAGLGGTAESLREMLARSLGDADLRRGLIDSAAAAEL
jgi:hypothetical protein